MLGLELQRLKEIKEDVLFFTLPLWLINILPKPTRIQVLNCYIPHEQLTFHLYDLISVEKSFKYRHSLVLLMEHLI